jgi:hypothetical protein
VDRDAGPGAATRPLQGLTGDRMTMSADEARRSLATRVAERDLISTNMHALYDSVGMKLLSGAALTGITKKTWNEANAELAGMLEIFTAYSEVLDRAAAMLGRTRRPAAAALAAVATLLTGPSVRLAAAPTPLGRRGLTETGRRELATLRADADRRLAKAARAVTQAQEAGRNAVAARAEAAEKIAAADLPWGPQSLATPFLEGQLAAAQAMRAGGQWSRLAAELASIEVAAAAEAERLRAAEREARWFLGRRHELWGLLGSYRAMADSLGGAEDPGLNAAFEQAEKLLVDAPCQLTTAAGAVIRYQRAVRRFRGEEEPDP